MDIEWWRTKTRERQRKFINAVDSLQEELMDKDDKHREFMRVIGKTKRKTRYESHEGDENKTGADELVELDDDKVFALPFGVATEELGEDEEEVLDDKGITVRQRTRIGQTDQAGLIKKILLNPEIAKRGKHRMASVIAKYEFIGRSERMAPDWDPDEQPAIDVKFGKSEKPFFTLEPCKPGYEGTYKETWIEVEGKRKRKLTKISKSGEKGEGDDEELEEDDGEDARREGKTKRRIF